MIVFNSWKLGWKSCGHHYEVCESQLDSVGNHNVVFVIGDVTSEHFYSLNIPSNLGLSEHSIP